MNYLECEALGIEGMSPPKFHGQVADNNISGGKPFLVVVVIHDKQVVLEAETPDGE